MPHALSFRPWRLHPTATRFCLFCSHANCARRRICRLRVCGFRHSPRVAACRTLEEAIGEIAGHPVRVAAAGRTDAGVHAVSQIVHFDTEAVRPRAAWVRGVNTHLPANAAVLWAHPVTADFHARFAATARHYTYVLLTRAERPGLLARRVGWYHRPLDIESMRAGAAYRRFPVSAFRARVQANPR
jgi:tRNA pseudouridine38-40 synthase